MLIFTRRENESFLIGDDTTITILTINGRQVRIGVDAPKDIPVHREEVYKRIKEGNLKDKKDNDE